MKPASAIRPGLASVVALYGLFMIAATSPRNQPEAYALQASEIEVKSVHVTQVERGSGAELNLRLRKKARPELRNSLPPLRRGRVRIMDGSTLVTEARVSRVIGEAGDKLAGLVLLFESLEEANRVATGLRASPRQMRLAPVNNPAGDNKSQDVGPQHLAGPRRCQSVIMCTTPISLVPEYAILVD